MGLCGVLGQWWSYQVTAGVCYKLQDLVKWWNQIFSRGSAKLSAALSDFLNIYRDPMCCRKMSDTADAAGSLEPFDVLLCGLTAVIISANAGVHGRLVTSYTDLMCHERASWGCPCVWVLLELPGPHLLAGFPQLPSSVVSVLHLQLHPRPFVFLLKAFILPVLYMEVCWCCQLSSMYF